MSLRALALAGPAVFTCTWAVLGAVEPGYDAKTEYISALAAQGEARAIVMTLGFVALTISLAATGAILHRERAGRGTIALFWVATGAVVLAAANRQACSTALAGCYRRVAAGPLLSDTNLHNGAATTMFLALLAAGCLLARRRVRSGATRVEVTFHVVAAATCILTPVLWLLRNDAGWGGALERVLATALLCWLTASVLATTHEPAAVDLRDRTVEGAHRRSGAPVRGAQRAAEATASTPRTR